MRPRKRAQAVGKAAFGLLVAATLFLLAQAQADEPVLAVRLTGGESTIYALGEVERMGFVGEDTLVVVTESGSDSYAAGTIRRIDFLWEPVSVEDPTDAAALIDAIHLFQNQPNPFSPETRIAFELPQGGEVALGIYSPDGRLVRMLVLGERSAGRHTVFWDGLNDSGRRVSSGVYFYSLRAPGIEEGRRMILLR